MVARTRRADQPSSSSPASSSTRLAFKDKLVTKGTQTTDTYLRKLKALHHNLTQLDQDQVDVASLDTVRADLINPLILLHSDRGVKAYAACCLVDILGLYAPEAPYTEDELVDIFKFITTQLGRGLKSPADTYFAQYFHVLESLSSVKSVVLICDLPTADALLHNVFRDFFALIRKDFSKQVETFMTDILVALIDEVQSLPQPVVDILLAQFSDKNISTDQPAFRLATNVCRQTADKLQRHVSMYFSDLMVDHLEEEELTEIRKAHQLIKHIHSACPNLLHSVIPLIEEQARTEDLLTRTLATETLGDMYADKGGTDLAKKYPTTFKAWLGRMNDRVPTVRIKAIEGSRLIFTNHAELRDSIEEILQTKILDPEERVRAAVCKMYGQLDFEVILHHVPREHLQHIAGRTEDRKQSVRVETLKTLGKLYNLAYPLIENNDPAAIQQFSWIPNSILLLMTMNLEGRPSVEQTLYDYIFPLPSSPSPKDKSSVVEVDETRWTDRLLTVMNFLEDEKATKAVMTITNMMLIQPTPYQRFLDACIANNGGVIDENEESVKNKLKGLIHQHSLYYHDPVKTTEDLEAFAELNDQTLYKILEKCMSPHTDIKTLAKKKDEFYKRVAEKAAGIAPTMKVFLRRAMFQIVNQSSIPTLLRRLEAGQRPKATDWASASGAKAMQLLTHASKTVPVIFKTHRSLLLKAISTEDESMLSVACLRALSALIRVDKESAPSDKPTIERFARYVTGSGEKHAKFAARLLTDTPNQSAACGRAVDTLTENLDDASPEVLVAHVSALAQFSLIAPDAFESKSDVIYQFLLKKLLLVPSEYEVEYDEMGNEVEPAEWIPDDQLPDLYQAKVLALKTFRNRSRVYANTDRAMLVSEPPFKIFHSLVECNGVLNKEAREDPILLSRLRLTAAVALVELSTISPTYARAVLTHFQQLALVCQDPCYEVRFKFLNKLIALLKKLPPVYNIVPFLTVHDPEIDLRSAASACITNSVHRLPAVKRTPFFGHLFIRFLHFLAHHPDFNDTEEKDLQEHSKYIRYYLELVGTPDNLPLCYYFAQKGKTVQDSDPDYSRNYWVMCELAQELIRAYASSQKWPLYTYPEKVKLPSDIFRPFKSVAEGRENFDKVYLDEAVIDWVKDLYGKKGEERKLPKRKAPATSNGNGPKRSRKKRKSDHRDDTDDDDDEEEDDWTSRRGTSDVEMANVSEDDDDDAGSGEEQLGRGARQKAKRKAKKKANSKG